VGCGAPLHHADAKEGETVDLGSGAGIDAFLSANKVGQTGSQLCWGNYLFSYFFVGLEPRIQWGQWDLNPAGKWVQLHYISDECIWPSTLSFSFEVW
jgi:hypothetical protein